MLPLIANEAAATALVGVDLFRNDRSNVSSQPRSLSMIAVTGGAAVGDTAVDLYIENFFCGRFTSSAIGTALPIYPDSYISLGNRIVPAGSKVSAVVGIQGGTNPTRVVVR